MPDALIPDTVAMTEDLPTSLTANCAEGRHGVCRCLLPGQNRQYAGLIVDLDEKTEVFKPIGICSCWCHEGEQVVP